MGQCCGFMIFWNGSGSGSGSAERTPYLKLMDTDPAIFVIDLQDANLIIKKFFCLLLFEGTFISVPLINRSGSGSRRPKNTAETQHCYGVCLRTVS